MNHLARVTSLTLLSWMIPICAGAQILNQDLGSSNLEHMDLHIFPDYNGDGFDDILVGIPDPTAPRVELRSGRSFALLLRLDAPFAEASFGWSVCNIRDTLAPFDGIDEIAVGAPESDLVYVYNSVGGFSTAPTAISAPTTSGSCIGSSVTTSEFGSAVEDIDADGDGVVELAVGSRRYSSFDAGSILVDDRGVVQIFDLQPATPVCISSYMGPLGLSEVGRVLANVGDVDPLPGEELVTNYGADAPGAIRVLNFSTSPGTLVRSLSISGAPGSPGGATVFGMAMATTVDYSGDGNPELIVGAPDVDHGLVGTEQGSVHAVPSTNLVTPGGATGPVYSFVDPLTTGQSLGLSVSGLVGTGDHNGDGNADMIVGKSGWSGCGAVESGVVYVITIGGGIIHTINAPTGFENRFFGHDVAAYHQLPSGRQLIAVVDPDEGRLYLYR